MDVLRTVQGLRTTVRAWRREGLRIGLVPTMGYLHAGHLSLVDAIRPRVDRVILTLFVNPTQFGPGEDLDAYPRDEAGDLEKAQSRSVDLVFVPDDGEMYPEGAETFVGLARLPQHLCGLARPVHFGGVATIVAKLFVVSDPDVAIFGEKDYQQLQVIRRMARDLLMDIEILGGPTIREPDGLAMSSRNQYLTPAERAAAPVIRRSLLAAQDALAGGERDVARLLGGIRVTIEDVGGRVDYVAIVDPETLEDLAVIDGSAHAAVAAFFGRARLIDNLRLSNG
ncbi:MAG: pantoate--beta-alanine ligase [Pseudomonadota bacterium]